MAASKRIQKEIAALSVDNHPYLNFGPIDESDLMNWKVTFIGPDDSPYAGGLFVLKIRLPTEYPMRPPRILFETKIYHPNISKQGEISIDVLTDCWSPALTVRKVVDCIVDLLREPNPDDNMDPEVAYVCKRYRAQFEQTAKEWTQRYANSSE